MRRRRDGSRKPGQNQAEEIAETFDDKAEAGILENIEKGGPNEEVAEAKADKIHAEGEATKDRLEDMADEMDDTPQ